MTASNILGLIIYLFVALMMAGIGISQIKSKKPVAFYSGEKPPKEEDLTDVNEWNKKHGIMWLVYGIIIMVSGFAGFLIGDDVLCVIPFCGGVMVPLIVMIWYHNRLRELYIIKL